MLAVFNKGGDFLDIVNVDNVESFIVKQQTERPGRMTMAIGVQDNKGQPHIIQTQVDMSGLESMASDGEARGELLVAAKCRRGCELWKCV